METIPQRDAMDKTTPHTQEIHPMIRINTQQMEQKRNEYGGRSRISSSLIPNRMPVRVFHICI